MRSSSRRYNHVEKYLNALGPRGFLSNYPDDVVCVINGQPVTKSDVRQGKMELQRRRLAIKRCNCGPVSKPCFIWTFHVTGFVMGGWHLYVRTLKHSWEITPTRITPFGGEELTLKIMGMWPCGYLPRSENFYDWKSAFAVHYPARRAARQGMVIARAKISSAGQLLDVMPVATPAGLSGAGTRPSTETLGCAYDVDKKEEDT